MQNENPSENTKTLEEIRKKVGREILRLNRTEIKFPKPVSEYLRKMADYRERSRKANFGIYGTA